LSNELAALNKVVKEDINFTSLLQIVPVSTTVAVTKNILTTTTKTIRTICSVYFLFLIVRTNNI